MTKLTEIEQEYKNGKIDIATYRKKMNNEHQILWQYKDWIKKQKIQKIIIDENIVIEKNSIKFIFDHFDKRTAAIELLTFGGYEEEERTWMLNFINNESVVLDIGANIGWYTIHYAKKAKLVLAFEPLPRTYDFLKKNISLNKLNNVKHFNFGLSNKNEEIEFYYDPKLSSASSMHDLYDTHGETITCNVKTLDGIMPKMTDCIDFIKCDVEGAEFLVLQGGKETLAKYKPILFLEMLRKWSKKFGYHPNDIIAFLKVRNYKCYCIRENELINVDNIDDQTVETNFFFFHIEKHKDLLKELKII